MTHPKCKERIIYTRLNIIPDMPNKHYQKDMKVCIHQLYYLSDLPFMTSLRQYRWDTSFINIGILPGFYNNKY